MTRAAFALLAAATLYAQPRLQNARLETRAVSGSLESTFRAIVNAQSGPAWIAYAAPLIPGEHNMCCWNSNVQCPGCTLEPQTNPVNFPPNPNATVRLEGASEFFVFYRVSTEISLYASHPGQDLEEPTGLLFSAPGFKAEPVQPPTPADPKKRAARPLSGSATREAATAMNHCSVYCAMIRATVSASMLFLRSRKARSRRR